MSKKDPIKRIKEEINKCKNSVDYFIDKYCKIKHPAAGTIPFKLFGYQKNCLSAFQDYRHNIFGKCRQSGISTLSGAYALWFAMFHKNKTILVVSKRDKDAKDFLARNIKFVYKELPDWMKAVWTLEVSNEHEVGFANGSKITSLPSGPETLRSNSASLNIIDEAAFCPHMEKMWAGGQPTLIHGGSVIVISTSNGVGGWYWETWTDAVAGENDFNPIVIDWWDMDWSINFIDDITGKEETISPTQGMKKCKNKKERDKYGEYWSPWLEDQYRQLSKKGGDSLFRQEVLRDFIGTGNTVLNRDTLITMQQQANKFGGSYKTLSHVDYVQPILDESFHLNFQERLLIWSEPKENHIYSMGVDISSGESNDWSAIEIFDIMDAEQVAELQIKVKPKELAVMADYLGRWYNQAFMVPERSGMGITVCQELEEMAYPNVFKTNMMPGGNNKTGKVGYNTTGVGKPVLNKALIDNFGEGGFIVKSIKLVGQAETYIHLNKSKTGAEGSMNDDLMLASGLAMVGTEIAASSANSSLLPFHANMQYKFGDNDASIDDIKDFRVIQPMSSKKQMSHEETIEDQLNAFSSSLLVPIEEKKIDSVTKRKKNPYEIKKYKH